MLRKTMRWSLHCSGKGGWKLTKLLAARPATLSVCLLLGVVACDSARNAVDTITFDTRSPYGGTDHPVGVKVGAPYKINGVRYSPKYQPDYVEEGVASWYGPGFHGRKTANGERYDQYEMTAAHTTLPMPSLVRVTRQDTGKSIIVRVNDRGPFAKGRIIDLSKAAAQELDMLGRGVAPVKVEYLEEETIAYMHHRGITLPSYLQGSTVRMAVKRRNEPAAPQEAAAQRASLPDQVLFRVQTASFRERDNAVRHVELLRPLAPSEVVKATYDGVTYYRVVTKPVSDYEKAIAVLHRAKDLGYTDARIMVE